MLLPPRNHLSLLLASSLTCLALLVATTQIHASELLTIGSEAPKLDIEHWVQDGKGKFQPVESFQPGQVYVVEFWATWCPPCIKSMPHLAELQQKYEKQIQIVSISDEDLKTVDAFLDRKVDNNSERSFRELTSAYCLTTDPDGSVYADYMQAAKQGGIPTAFVVGKDARIEWIGHPSDLDNVLDQVVEDSWDREAYAERVKTERELQAAMNASNYEKALELIDRLNQQEESLDVQLLKLQVLSLADKQAAASRHLQGLFRSSIKTADQTDMIAWNVFQMFRQGVVEDKQLVMDSIAAANAAAKIATDTKTQGSLYDTIAHLEEAQGNLDGAIAAAQKSLELSGGEGKARAEAYLRSLKENKLKKK